MFSNRSEILVTRKECVRMYLPNFVKLVNSMCKGAFYSDYSNYDNKTSQLCYILLLLLFKLNTSNDNAFFVSFNP